MPCRPEPPTPKDQGLEGGSKKAVVGRGGGAVRGGVTETANGHGVPAPGGPGPAGAEGLYTGPWVKPSQQPHNSRTRSEPVLSPSEEDTKAQQG